MNSSNVSRRGSSLPSAPRLDITLDFCAKGVARLGIKVLPPPYGVTPNAAIGTRSHSPLICIYVYHDMYTHMREGGGGHMDMQQ